MKSALATIGLTLTMVITPLSAQAYGKPPFGHTVVTKKASAQPVATAKDTPPASPRISEMPHNDKLSSTEKDI